MDQCHLIYIFISCLIMAMLTEIGFFIINKKTELQKIKAIAKELRNKR